MNRDSVSEKERAKREAQEVRTVKRCPHVTLPDGFDLMMPREVRSVVRDRAGNEYVQYPDGSLRRCMVRGGRKKYSRRKVRREVSALLREQVYRGSEKGARKVRWIHPQVEAELSALRRAEAL